MHILHIITGLSTGGAERMLVKLVRATKGEAQHTVLSLMDFGSQGENLKELGVKVFTLGMTGFVQSPKVILKLRKVVKQNSPDAIQGWMYHGNLFASLANKFTNDTIPYLYNIRHSLNDINLEKKTTQLIIHVNSWFSGNTSTIIYNSVISKKQHEMFGFSDKSSVVIPNGFNVNKYKRNHTYREQIRNEFDIAKDAIVFGQIGRDHPSKNHVGYLRAASLASQKNDDAHFIIVGRDVNKSERLKNLITELNISHIVTLIQERDDIERIWNAVDFGVLSSKWGEAFPNVIGEAMACERPCIVTDVGDCAYIVGEYGKVVPPKDSKKLGKAMLDFLLLNKRERNELGKKSRNRIINNFSIDQISNQYLNLYKKDVAKK